MFGQTALGNFELNLFFFIVQFLRAFDMYKYRLFTDMCQHLKLLQVYQHTTCWRSNGGQTQK